LPGLSFIHVMKNNPPHRGYKIPVVNATPARITHEAPHASTPKERKKTLMMITGTMNSILAVRGRTLFAPDKNKEHRKEPITDPAKPKSATIPVMPGELEKKILTEAGRQIKPT